MIVPSVASGLLIAFSLPPWGWWPLAFAGAALLYWRLAGLPTTSRVLAGWAAGMGCFVPGLWWAAAFNWYGAVVLMVVEAVPMALAAAFVPRTRWRAPAFAGAFTLAEALRTSWPFGGLPLGGVFLGQAGGPLLGSARLGGPLLMTALVWLGGAGVAELWLAGARWWSSSRTALGAAARGPQGMGAFAPGLVALLLVAAVSGAAALAPGAGAQRARITVALVQGGGRRGVSAAESSRAAVFAAQLDATDGLGERTGDPPALVVWPEDVIAVGARLAGTSEAKTMSALARQLKSTVVAGVTETVSPRSFRNEAVVWGPTGAIVGTYEKVHRVPFGEYVPGRSFFAHLASLQAVPRDAIAGRGSGLVRTPAGPLGLMISYEVFFATRGRSAVRAGARVLVVPTNDSSYATSQVPSDELAADRVQAVAEGRTLVQAAPTGYSAVVAASGRIVERSPLGRRRVLVASVALRTGHTPYEEAGDTPVLIAAAVALAVALVAAWLLRAGVVRRRGWARRPRW